jgi:integral membrane protein
MPNPAKHRETVTRVLNQYRVAANVTGVFLIIITILYVIRLSNSTDLWLLGPRGFLWFETFTLDADDFRVGLPDTGINLTSIVLIVHGWLYVAYLYTDFRLWSLLRWSLWRFLLIAAGGVVPFLSFFAERHYRKITLRDIDALPAEETR